MNWYRVGAFALAASLWAPVILLLASCAGHTPAPAAKIVAQEVDRPVAASCVPSNLGPEPAYRVTTKMIVDAPDMAARYQLVAAALAERIDRLTQVEPVVAGCRKPGGAQ